MRSFEDDLNSGNEKIETDRCLQTVVNISEGMLAFSLSLTNSAFTISLTFYFYKIDTLILPHYTV